MTRPELVDAIIAEIDRVWGTEGFEGTGPEHEWLAATHGIT